MITSQDKSLGVSVSYNSDWSGDAIVRWRMFGEDCEWTVSATALVRGWLILGPAKGTEPPPAVVARAVSLAAFAFVRSKLYETMESLP